MAQRRMIGKDTCESDSFAELNNSNAQLLCCLLTPWWDDHGKMIGDEIWIKGNIVRKLKQFTEKEISACLRLINDNLDVQWWVDEKGNKWLYWNKFDTHQTISEEKKTKDIYPSPKIPKNPQKTPSTRLSRSISIREDKEEDKGLVTDIISDFNLVMGSNFTPTNKNTIKFIKARLNDGFVLDDFKVVHRKKLRSWGADPKMVKYLRPETLYGNKFESYLQEKEFNTKLTPEGIKAYLIGKSWLQTQEVVDVK